MLALENAEEVLQILDRYTKQKSKDIPPELDEYLNYVAKTGDTVYRWPTVQYLFREKLINVIKEFHDTTASIEDLPQCPNVDQFNYESMKSALIEKLERFQAAPFTVQRLCELLTDPKKHYSRLDKFMRALEKNILVVSTVEPGRKPTTDGEENGDEPMNGITLSDNNIDTIDKENNKMDEEANGSAESIDTIASKLTEEPAADVSTAIPSAVVEANTDPVEADIKNGSSAEVDAIVSEEPVAAATAAAAPITNEDAAKDDAPAGEEPIVAEVDAAVEKKTDVDKVLVDEAKPEEIAQIIESLDLPPVAVEKIEKIDKPLTPKHARDEDDLNDDLEDGAHNAKKMRLIVNDDIDAAIASLPTAELPTSSESKADEEKIDDEPAAEPPIEDVAVVPEIVVATIEPEIQKTETSAVEPIETTPIESTPTAEPVEEAVAVEPTPIEEAVVDSAENKPAVDSEITPADKSAAEPDVTTPIEPTPATDSVKEAVPAETAPIESAVTDVAAKTEAVVGSEEAAPAVPVEEPIVIETPKPIETPAEATPALDLPVPEFLAQNITALIPTDLLPAVNESDMAPAVVAPEPIVNQESMTVEEPEAAIAAVEAVDENTEKMDAAPINDDQMDVDDAADAPMDL